MRSLSIRKKLLACFLGILGLLLILAVFTLSTLGRLSESVDRAVNKTTKRLVLADAIKTATSEMLSAQRGVFQLTLLKNSERAEELRREFGTQSKLAKDLMEEFMPLIATEEGRKMIKDLQADIGQWDRQFAEISRLLASGSAEEAGQLSREKTIPIAKHAFELTTRLQKIQLNFLENDKKAAAADLSAGRWVSFVLIGIALLIGVVVFLLVQSISKNLNRFARELMQGAAQVTGAAAQVSQASQSLAQGASEQAASLEETSSSTEEITSMTHKNADNSHQAAELVANAGKGFDVTEARLKEMLVSMNQINASSDKVAKIIKVIDEIAFQTNILALNAAVEAARAGEAGMGFAVVADEVRNLAQRCAQAAKDTAELIEESIDNSRDGSQKLSGVESAIKEISEEAKQVQVLVDEVSVGSKEQANGLDQIAKAIGQMEQVTQKTAASAEESASAGEELSAQADTLRHLVQELTAFVEGAAATRQPVVGYAKPLTKAAAPSPGPKAQPVRTMAAAAGAGGDWMDDSSDSK